MAVRKPVTDAEKAMALNYPSNPSNKGRAVVWWKSHQCDLGRHGSEESFHTLLALRTHFAAGNSPPQMKLFRQTVLEEVRPDLSNAQELLTSLEQQLSKAIGERDSLRMNVERDRDALESRIAEVEQSLEGAIEQREELRRENRRYQSELESSQAAIAALQRKKPWATRGIAAVASLLAVASVWWTMTTEPTIDNRPLTLSEVESIQGVRSGELLVQETGVPPMLDGTVISDDERDVILSLRAEQDRFEAYREEHQSHVEELVNTLRKDKGAKEWLRERFAEQSP